jgi:hypothetical protein
MEKLERIIEQARRLSPRDQRKLIAALNRSRADGKIRPRQSRKRVASAKGPYAALLELAGTAHSDYHDVSSDKYKHLAEIYADLHEDE